MTRRRRRTNSFFRPSMMEFHAGTNTCRGNRRECAKTAPNATFVDNPRKRGRKKKARKVIITRTVREVRKTNPRKLYMLIARKGRTGPVLKYVKGMKFAMRGKVVLFGNRDSANTVASVLRLKFPALRGYTLSVV